MFPVNKVVCGPCHSFSGHLFERLGSELGARDGMTTKSGFCAEFVDACEGQIEFPAYDGESYCDKHVGGSSDMTWSYPIDENGERVSFASAVLVLYLVFGVRGLGLHSDIFRKVISWTTWSISLRC